MLLEQQYNLKKNIYEYKTRAVRVFGFHFCRKRVTELTTVKLTAYKTGSIRHDNLKYFPQSTVNE